MSETTEKELPLLSLRQMRIEQELILAAGPARVWRALTAEVGAWWGAPYLCCDSTQRLELDLRCGGGLVEHGADGTQVLWGVVTGFTPDRMLCLEGSCGMQWPASGEWTYLLEAEGDGATRMRFTHRALGDFGPEKQAGYGAGWADLLDGRLRAWVERGEPLGIER